MMKRFIRLYYLAVLTFAGASAPSPAALAQDAACEAVQRTEGMRAEGRYREARSALLACVNAQCGGDVRRRCAATLQKLDAITPSVVVRVEDASGNDLTDVEVALGDEPLVDALDGMAIPVDPGEHTFVFRRKGAEPVTRTVTIREGEKFRPLDITSEPEPVELPPEANDGERAQSISSGRLAAGATLIGVGAAGVGGFALLGLSARSRESDLENGCSPACSPDWVDAVERRYILANLSLGVGLIALGAGTWLLLSAPGSNGGEAEPAALALEASPEGAFASFSGRF